MSLPITPDMSQFLYQVLASGLQQITDKALQHINEDGDDLASFLKDYHTTQLSEGVTDTYFDKYLTFVVQKIQPFYAAHPEKYQAIRDEFYPNCDCGMSQFPSGSVPTIEEIQSLLRHTDECYLPWVLFENDRASLDIHGIDQAFLIAHPILITLLEQSE